MKHAQRLLSILEKAGFEAYIVGGAVRDILLGKEPHDIDIVTKAKPEEVQEILRKNGIYCTDLVGKSFGVVVAKIESASYEIATFRKERYGQDAHRPEVVEYADTLEEDVQRRDFTINGMAMNAFGNIVDYVGGQKDLKRKELRTIGVAKERFSEDALRLFRACRFLGQLDFIAHPSLVDGMTPAFYRVQGLSLARVRQELEKLLLTPYVARGLDLLVRSGLSSCECTQMEKGVPQRIPILPELSHLVDLPQEPVFHHWDGWMHTLVAVSNTPLNLVERYGALFHDVAKGLPDIREIINGRMTDRGHDVLGAEMAQTILLRLGYPKKFAELVSWIVKGHMKFHYFANNEEADAVKWMRKEARSGRFKNTEELKSAVESLGKVCIADVIATGRERSSTDGTEAFGEYLLDILDNMPVHTKDLHYPKVLVEEAGAYTREVLQYLMKRVQDGAVENEEGPLLELGRRWLERRSLTIKGEC